MSTEKPQTDSIDKYKEDIETIKDILTQVDNKPLFRHWVFYTWGTGIIVGTIINYIVSTRSEFTTGALFVRVWDTQS